MNTAGSPPSWFGQKLGDQQRYKLVQQLGGGSIGDVYLAIDTRLGRRVAIKLLKGALAKSKEVLARFEREVILSAALESEHIVEVLDYGIAAGDYPFYVMEYLNGQPLNQLIGRSTRLSADLAIQIAIQICAGLKVAHEGVVLWREGEENTEKIKVIHRDLKPANIFLVPTAIGALVKVLDFGIAKKLHTTEQSNQTNLTQAFLGTFRYAAPEQIINARNLDERADLYSLGMILYEMLSGTDPFGVSKTPTQRREVAWAMAHSSGQPVPLRQQSDCANLPADLEEIVMHCLKRRVSERFGSASELMQALHAVAIARKEVPPRSAQAAAGLETTGAKPLAPLLDPTVYRPLVSEANRPLDATIAQPVGEQFEQQPISALQQSESVIPAPAGPALTDGTIVQIPTPSPNNQTIAQVFTPSAPADGTMAQVPPLIPKRDETVAQVPPPIPKRDETVAQVPPLMPKRDETVAQMPPPLKKRDETIVQAPSFATARRDETLAQVPIPQGNLRPNEMIANAAIAEVSSALRSRLPLPLANLISFLSRMGLGANGYPNPMLRQVVLNRLLLMGAGFLIGLLMMAGAYVFMRSSQPQTQKSSEAAPSVRA